MLTKLHRGNPLHPALPDGPAHRDGGWGVDRQAAEAGGVGRAVRRSGQWDRAMGITLGR